MREHTAQQVRRIAKEPADEERERQALDAAVPVVGAHLRHLCAEPGEDGKVPQQQREGLPRQQLGEGERHRGKSQPARWSVFVFISAQAPTSGTAPPVS